tara:strand:- start:1057 stop:1914 length:858 start_codon:yes stop_codon:yes gene_type:complete
MTPKFLGYARAATAIMIGLTISATDPAGAQTMIGKRHSEAVSVDLSVLNQLGTAPTVPKLLHPSVRSLLMPNNRQPARSQFTSIGISRPKSPSTSTSTSTVHLKLPTEERKETTPAHARNNKKSLPKRRTVTPTAPKTPPQHTTAITPKVAVPPPPMKLSRPLAKLPPPPKQRRSLTGGFKPSEEFRLAFGTGSAEIAARSNTKLDKVVQILKRDGNLRLQLLAYAGGGSQTPSQARRLSLSRALAVRSRLIEKGIRSTRIDVRALGKKSDGGPPDRIDIIITAR